MTLRDKLQVANLAVMVPLSEMTLKMHVQVSLLRKLAVAVLTLVGFDAQMFSDVNLQPRFLVVRDLTDGACVHLLPITH